MKKPLAIDLYCGLGGWAEAAHDHRQMFDDCIEPMCKENRATLLEWRFEEEITEALK